MKPHIPMNVVHIASGDLWAGAEVQLFTLAKTLHQFDNVTVRIILLNPGELADRLRKEGIEVAVVDESALNGFQIFWRLRKRLLTWHPDVVHTHRIKENILGGLAAKLAGNIPSLRTVHGAPEHPPGWRKPHKRIFFILNWLMGRYVQRNIIAVSDDLAERLKKDFPANKIHVIENGIDLDSIKRQIDDAKPHLNPKEHTFKVGLVGRLVPVKRVDLFIQTARYFRDHYQDLRTSFHVYGDGPLLDELNELCNDIGVTDIVHLEGHCQDIHQRIEELDVLMMTSDHEGLPMTLLEAMALGTPIIAHAVGGIPKLLCGGACGVLVSEHSPSFYAQATYSLLNDPELSESISEKALKQISQNYNAKYNATQYLERYHEGV